MSISVQIYAEHLPGPKGVQCPHQVFCGHGTDHWDRLVLPVPPCKKRSPTPQQKLYRIISEKSLQGSVDLLSQLKRKLQWGETSMDAIPKVVKNLNYSFR